MQKLMKAMHKNEKGFTLVELMVVVVIIAILVAIAIPLFGGVQANARNRACQANQRTIDGAISMALAEGLAPTEWTTFIDGTPECPGDGNAGTEAAYTLIGEGDLARVNGCPGGFHDAYR